ncbi:MAG TPA: N,N-dimethylformamidase beta subunit family domain-containing protein [Micromonosporaceae bacterium]
MWSLSRRSVLGAIALGLAGVAAGVPAARLLTGTNRVSSLAGHRLNARPESTATRSAGPGPVGLENRITVENALPGSPGWRVDATGVRAVDDLGRQIQGYPSATSVPLGGSIDFQVSVATAQRIRVEIFRTGFYQGAGARLLIASPPLPGQPQPEPVLDPDTGMITCDWPPVWTLAVPSDWTPGVHLAVFTTESGWRATTPFVVRDERPGPRLCVVMPFSTYQAYNQWPLNGWLGKSLYYGYDGADRAVYANRAVKVSFDRPYAGHGQPKRFERDLVVVRWLERQGYDLTYASSHDLHAGRLDPGRYAGLVFPGHDEYWSRPMRDAVERGVEQGTGMAFLTANNLYWRVRFEPGHGGGDRVMVCYKSDPDPHGGADDATKRWRDLGQGAHQAEQRLLGVQYNGVVAGSYPLIVRAAGHWVWAGCGLAEGDRLPGIVGGEADGLDERGPRPAGSTQTLLSASPYVRTNGTPATQNTSVYETRDGTVVFTAGSLDWSLGLVPGGYAADPRVAQATTNVLNRIVRPR